MGSSTTTTSTPSPTSSRTRRGSWASTRWRVWSTSSNRRPANALRLLAPCIRRLAAERGRRRHERRVGVRAAAGAVQRASGLRPDAHRRAQPQRHQGRTGALPRRLVDGRRARRRDGTARVDGGRPADVPSARAPGETGGEHRQDFGRPAVAQRRFVVVEEEARQYGVEFDTHDARYARTAEWLQVVTGLWSEPRFSFSGSHYHVENAALEPKPLRRPRPTLYAGGESGAAKALISSACDA